MTSSEKILAGIINEAEQKAAEIAAEAEQKATALVESEKESARRQALGIQAEAEKKASMATAAGRSAAELYRRDAALACKRELIEQTLTDAVEHLNALPDEEYFDFLLGLIEKSRLEGAGEILLSARDLARERGTFDQKAAAWQLTVCSDPAEINGGFILRYHDILINGEWSALIREKREALVDRIHGILFS